MYTNKLKLLQKVTREYKQLNYIEIITNRPVQFFHGF